MADGKKKKILYVNRKAPYGTIYALEALEVVLIGAAFEQDVGVAFLKEELARGELRHGLDQHALQGRRLAPSQSPSWTP